MASDLRLVFKQSVGIQDLENALSASKSMPWEVTMTLPRLKEPPTGKEADEYFKQHPLRRRTYMRSGQVTITDPSSGLRVYINGDASDDESYYLISYSQETPRLAMLKEVLRVLLQPEGSQIRWIGTRCLSAYGPDLVS